MNEQISALVFLNIELLAELRRLRELITEILVYPDAKLGNIPVASQRLCQEAEAIRKESQVTK